MGSTISRNKQSRSQVLQVAPAYSRAELELIKVVENARPRPHREFDQIPMRAEDLLRQVKFMVPKLAGKSVVFVGDYDGTSMIVGLLGLLRYAQPAHMHVLDFDERVLETIKRVATEHDFAHKVTVSKYDVFDRVPPELEGIFDWFYTNPPYGASNNGESARLFITRGIELVKPQGSWGCVILPSDDTRAWTEEAMRATQEYVLADGWIINHMEEDAHRYHLDDDKELSSSVLLIHRRGLKNQRSRNLPYAGRRVAHTEIPRFYSRSMEPPYPHFISPEDEPIYRSA